MSWLESNFYIPEPRDPITGACYPEGPIRLSDEQKAVLREAIRRDEDDKVVYSTFLYSVPKKSGKSTLIAAYITWWACVFGAHRYHYCLANDGKQSTDRLLRPILKCINLHRKLGGILAESRITKTLVELPNGGVIEAIPCDASGEAGAEPSLVAFSELWAFDTPAKERLWTELTIPPTLWGRSQRIVESYAGFVGKSRLLEQLYEIGTGKENPAMRHPSFPNLAVYVNGAASMLSVWDHEPRMAWQTSAYYKQEAQVLTPEEFERVHRNRWVSPINSFVEPLAWDRCADEAIDPEEIIRKTPNTVVVMGVDAGVSMDGSACIALCRHPNPDLHETDLVILAARIWEPAPGHPINLAETVEATIREWAEKWYVYEVAYDPHEMTSIANVVYQKDAVAWLRPFGQVNARLVSDKLLYDLIVHKRIHYHPYKTLGIEDLSRHIKQAGRQEDPENRKLRIVKVSKTSSAKVDGAVALSMAAHRCLQLAI